MSRDLEYARIVRTDPDGINPLRLHRLLDRPNNERLPAEIDQILGRYALGPASSRYDGGDMSQPLPRHSLAQFVPRRDLGFKQPLLTVAEYGRNRADRRNEAP